MLLPALASPRGVAVVVFRTFDGPIGVRLSDLARFFGGCSCSCSSPVDAPRLPTSMLTSVYTSCRFGGAGDTIVEAPGADNGSSESVVTGVAVTGVREPLAGRERGVIPLAVCCCGGGGGGGFGVVFLGVREDVVSLRSEEGILAVAVIVVAVAVIVVVAAAVEARRLLYSRLILYFLSVCSPPFLLSRDKGEYSW
jgi:hypothetical protein